MNHQNSNLPPFTSSLALRGGLLVDRGILEELEEKAAVDLNRQGRECHLGQRRT